MVIFFSNFYYTTTDIEKSRAAGWCSGVDGFFQHSSKKFFREFLLWANYGFTRARYIHFLWIGIWSWMKMIKSRAVDDDKMIIICFEFIISLLLYFSIFIFVHVIRLYIVVCYLSLRSLVIFINEIYSAWCTSNC